MPRGARGCRKAALRCCTATSFEGFRCGLRKGHPAPLTEALVGEGCYDQRNWHFTHPQTDGKLGRVLYQWRDCTSPSGLVTLSNHQGLLTKIVDYIKSQEVDNDNSG